MWIPERGTGDDAPSEQRGHLASEDGMHGHK